MDNVKKPCFPRCSLREKLLSETIWELSVTGRLCKTNTTAYIALPICIRLP